MDLGTNEISSFASNHDSCIPDFIERLQNYRVNHCALGEVLGGLKHIAVYGLDHNDVCDTHESGVGIGKLFCNRGE